MPSPQELEDLGLSRAEASVYLTLVIRGPLGAQAVSELSEIARSRVYPALRSLADRGLVEGAVGYGVKFRAVPPELALPSFIDQQRELLYQRERMAKELAEQLAELQPDLDRPDGDMVEIVRDQRALAERFRRLHHEVQEEILNFAKAPIIITRRGNPLGEATLKRGVKIRAVYERALLESGEFEDHIRRMVALGEEARVYEGELPMKLTLFDARVSLTSLASSTGDITSLVVRNPGLGALLRTAFDVHWEASQPLTDTPAEKRRKKR